MDISTHSLALLPAWEKTSKSGRGPEQPCLSPCYKGLGLLFVPQLEMGSCPCLSRKLLFGRRRKSQATPERSPPPQCHMLCISPTAPARAQVGVGGLGSPCHPASKAPEAWHHRQRWRLSAPRRRAFRGTRIARPQDREALSLKHGPPPQSRKDHMLGGPKVPGNR